MIVSVSFFPVAQAQVVYTDVNPDRTFNTGGAVYHLDLNNDGINDFNISYTTQTKSTTHCGTHTNSYIRIMPLNQNEVSGDDSNNVPAVESNVIINSTAFTWKDTTNEVLASQSWSPCKYGCYDLHFCVWVALPSYHGNWAGAVDKYIPLRLHAGSNTYYGWVRLDVAANRDSFTIKDYAYNLIPNQSILAGETSCTAPTVTLHANGPLSFCAGGRRNAKSKRNRLFISMEIKRYKY